MTHLGLLAALRHIGAPHVYPLFPPMIAEISQNGTDKPRP